MATKRIAQIDVATGFVGAVVDMMEPIPEAPAGKLFQECDDLEKSGMYWNGHDYQKEPLT